MRNFAKNAIYGFSIMADMDKENNMHHMCVLIIMQEEEGILCSSYNDELGNWVAVVKCMWKQQC